MTIHALVTGALHRAPEQRESKNGRLKAETFTSLPSGETKISLSLVADQILPLRQPPKQRQAKPKEPAKAAEPGGAPVFDDAIQF
jgi:hypothetical protein